MNATDTDSLNFEGEIQRLISDYERRAKKLRGFAYVLLFVAIILILLAGHIVIFESQNLAREDLEKLLVTTFEPFDFNDIAIGRSNKATIAVGNDGSIRVSKDGKSWEDPGSKTDKNLLAVAFNGRTAVAAGDDGTIRFSQDSGRHWKIPDNSDNIPKKDFKDVALSEDGKTAIAVGRKGFIRFSNNGGQGWFPPSETTTTKNLNAIALSEDGSFAIAAGNDETILFYKKSIDIDEKWVQGKNLNNGSGESKDDFTAVTFSRKNNIAVVVGDNDKLKIVSTISQEWLTLEKSPLENSGNNKRRRKSDLFAVAGSEDGKTYIAVGENGTIWHSIEGYTKWKQVSLNVSDDLNAVALSNNGKDAIVVGEYGTVLVSHDHGKHWKPLDSKSANDLLAVEFIDNKTGIVVGKNMSLLRAKSSGNKGDDSITPVNVPKLKTTETRKPANNEQSSISERMIQLGIIRTAIIVLALFLGNHLISFSRYNIRLAAFYDGRRDAILISRKDIPKPMNIEDLTQLIHAASPDNLGFGQSSQTVMDQAARGTRAIPSDRRIDFPG